MGTATTTADFFTAASKGLKPSSAAARAVVRETFAQRNVGDYIVKLIASPAIQGCFEELFIISVLLTQQRSWAGIAREYGVKDAPGCLAALADAVKRKHLHSEASEAFREIAAGAVDTVLVAAAGDDEDVFLEADGVAVFKALQKTAGRVFANLSNVYFSSVLNRAAVRDLPPLNGKEKQAITAATKERADFIVAKFGEAFVAKQQTTYRDLLRVLAGNPEWFLGKLRVDLEPQAEPKVTI